MRYLIVAISLLVCQTALADGEGWTTVDARYTVWRKPDTQHRLTLRTAAELHIAGRTEGFQQVVAGFTPVYQPVEWFSIGIGGAYEGEMRSNRTMRHEGRLEIEPTFMWRAGIARFQSRNRIEARFFSDGNRHVRYRTQFRVALAKDGWPVHPFVFDELFIVLDKENVNQNRAAAGIAIPVGKNARFDLFYMMRSRAAAPAWEHDHCAVLNIALSG